MFFVHHSLYIKYTSGSDIAEQSNIFVETAIAYALQYVFNIRAQTKFNQPTITILADNDYYSQQVTSKSGATVSAASRFATFDTPIWSANKTGLGSSAALVTALVGALLTFYLPAPQFSLENAESKRSLHNLAQAAHCAAQGKVGSGFDIASAVSGSCVYRRFSPSLLEGLADANTAAFPSRLRSVVEDTGMQNWDVEIEQARVSIPKGLRLVMCDVDCGSKTPGMVKQVLQWRKEKPKDAGRIWGELQKTNDDLAAELVRLARGEEPSDYDTLKQILAKNRKLVREMSKESGVPIEPEAQTKLLDACSELEGVIGGVTPGAGGYDADVLLVKDDAEVMGRLEAMLKSYKFEVNGAKTTGSGRVGLLGVREEMEGVRVESEDGYKGWIEAE